MSATANPLSGSIVILYDPDCLGPQSVWRRLSEIGLVPPAMPPRDDEAEPLLAELWRRLAVNVGADILARMVVGLLV